MCAVFFETHDHYSTCLIFTLSLVISQTCSVQSYFHRSKCAVIQVPSSSLGHGIELGWEPLSSELHRAGSHSEMKLSWKPLNFEFRRAESQNAYDDT